MAKKNLLEVAISIAEKMWADGKILGTDYDEKNSASWNVISNWDVDADIRPFEKIISSFEKKGFIKVQNNLMPPEFGRSGRAVYDEDGNQLDDERYSIIEYNICDFGGLEKFLSELKNTNYPQIEKPSSIRDKKNLVFNRAKENLMSALPFILNSAMEKKEKENYLFQADISHEFAMWVRGNKNKLFNMKKSTDGEFSVGGQNLFNILKDLGVYGISREDKNNLIKSLLKKLSITQEESDALFINKNGKWVGNEKVVRIVN